MRALADLPGRDSALTQWFQAEGAALHHRPDVVLLHWLGRNKHKLVDVKTFDPACARWLRVRSDSVRFAAHRRKEAECVSQEYRVTPDAPLPDGLTLCVFTVSTFGSFGEPALRLFRALSKRAGRVLPVPLLPYSSWATPSVGPYARAAVSFAVRRGLAERLRDRWFWAPTPPAGFSPADVGADPGDGDEGVEDWGSGAESVSGGESDDLG